MVICYMVVTPNPFTMPTSGSYFVKVGDGQSSQAYHRCNPSHAYVENHLAPVQYLDVQTYNYNLESKQPGKWLEWIHIKVTGGMEVYQRTEWYELQVKLEDDAEELRNVLCRMLDLFPYWNRWEEYAGSDDATTEFENLVDGTWSCNHDKAIAQFVSRRSLLVLMHGYHSGSLGVHWVLTTLTEIVAVILKPNSADLTIWERWKDMPLITIAQGVWVGKNI